ncbi:MAG: hypothetical protein ACI4OP_01200 [Candidatus Coprovivens sp.]
MNYYKKLVIKGSIPKTIKDCVINSFEEEYTAYLKNAGRKWRTKQGFSLDYDTTLEDLEKCHFVYVTTPEMESLLKRKLNVIEEI